MDELIHYYSVDVAVTFDIDLDSDQIDTELTSNIYDTFVEELQEAFNNNSDVDLDDYDWSWDKEHDYIQHLYISSKLDKEAVTPIVENILDSIVSFERTDELWDGTYSIETHGLDTPPYEHIERTRDYTYTVEVECEVIRFFETTEDGEVLVEKVTKNELKDRAKKHAKKQRGITTLNPDAGNVEYNIGMFNKMSGAVEGPSNNPVSGPFGGNVGGDGMGEGIQKKEPILYVIKDSHGNILSRPNEDDGELWDRVSSMEARGRRGLSVVVCTPDMLKKEELEEARDPYFTPYGYKDAAKVLNGKAPEYYYHLKEIEMDQGDGEKLARYARKLGLPVVQDPNDDPDYPTFYILGKYHWNDYFYPYPSNYEPKVEECLTEAASNKETIELEYKDLEFTQYGNQRDADDWDEWDRCIDWTYEVDKDDLYTFIFESCIDETDFPLAFEDDFDPNNAEDWAKFESWLDDNFDAIYSKYEEKILENWEEDAAEQAAQEYDPDDYVDWDSMTGGHDDRYWEDLKEGEEVFMEKYSMGPSEEYKQEPRMIDYFEQMNKEDDFSETEQEFSSAATSINGSKLPAIFKLVDFHANTLNLDYGGGKFDNATEYLKTLGVTNLIYDKFNRTAQHNQEVIRAVLENGGADTCTLSNVLNVIKEESIRHEILVNIYKLLKSDGILYITVFEGKPGQKEGPTKSGYQLARKTSEYIDEVANVFGEDKVTRRGKLIVARK